MKRLLIIYHSQSGNTQRLAAAVYAGALRENDVCSTIKRVQDAGLADLVETDALLLGSPENFGTMSGAVKDFFDRTFYPAQDQGINLRALPYALFISAGNDGSGAIRQIDRIVGAYPMKQIAQPLICIGEADDAGLLACEELGQGTAAGLSLGIF